MTDARNFVTRLSTDTSKFNLNGTIKELDQLNKSLIDNQQQQKECNKIIKSTKDELEKAKKEIKDSGSATDQQREKIDKLKQTLEEQKLKLAQLKSEQTVIKSAIRDTAKTAVSSVDEVNKKVEESADTWTTLKETLAHVAADGVEMLSSKLIELAKDIVNTGMQFESAMSEVAAITGATGSELEALEETAKKYGATTKFSATETAQALKYMGLAGWDAKTSMEALPGILNLAAASGMDLAAASDMVTDYLTAFGLSAEKAAYMADLLTYAQSNSNTSAVQLGQAWGNCAANLHAAGQDIETVTAMLESMANQGLKGSEAGTALAAIMRDITSNMNDGKIAIGNMLISVTDAYGNFRDLTDIMADVEKAVAGMGSAERTAALDATFTARSLKGVNLILEEGSEAVSGYENDLRQSMGSAEKAAGTMSDNLAGDLKTLESGLESLKISIFEDAESPLRDLVHFITDEGIPALKWLYENIEDITEIFAPFAEGINSLLAMPKTSQRELKQTISRESEIVAEIAELDELIRKAEERAAHDRTGSTSTEYIDQLKAEKAALQDRLEKLKSEEEQLKTTQKAVVNLTESEKANTITVKENSEAVDDYTKKSGDLEKYLSTLSDSYKKLDNGQEISLSTILSLIDKYPEYARQLMDAKGNIDLQKSATESLFEAKKQEYLLTQKATMDKITMSNEETEVILSNLQKQFEAYASQVTVLEGMRAILGNTVVDAEKERAQKLAEEARKNIEEYKSASTRYNLVKSMNINDFAKQDTSTTKQSTSSSKQSSSDSYYYSGYDVKAYGSTQLEAALKWLDRAQNLGKISTQQALSHLKQWKTQYAQTADEIYDIDHRIYQAQQKLESDQTAAIKKQLDLVRAAYEKAADDKIALFKKQADAAKEAADKEIKALDDLQKKRNEENEDAKRKAELDKINVQLKYKHLDELSRMELLRRKQDIVNEQAEADFSRQIETKKQTLQGNADAAALQYDKAVGNINSLLERLNYFIAAQTGTVTNQQIVNNNNSRQNFQIVASGISSRQLTSEIVRELYS